MLWVCGPELSSCSTSDLETYTPCNRDPEDSLELSASLPQGPITFSKVGQSGSQTQVSVPFYPCWLGRPEMEMGGASEPATNVVIGTLGGQDLVHG